MMQRLMRRMGSMPAFIVGRRWDVLASNDALHAAFFDFESVPPDERNLIWFHFTNPAARSLANWEDTSREVLARFRMDYGRHAGESDFVELVERLKSVSPEFAEWWPSQDVRPLSEGRVELMRGTLLGDHITLSMAENPDLRLIVIIPDDDSLGKIGELTVRTGLKGGIKAPFKQARKLAKKASNRVGGINLQPIGSSDGTSSREVLT